MARLSAVLTGPAGGDNVVGTVTVAALNGDDWGVDIHEGDTGDELVKRVRDAMGLDENFEIKLYLSVETPLESECTLEAQGVEDGTDLQSPVPLESGCTLEAQGVEDGTDLSVVVARLNSPLDDDTIRGAVARWCAGDQEAVSEEFGVIGEWNVGDVTNMERLFYGQRGFDADLNDWNIGNVKTMALMFCGATSFNQDLGKWGKVVAENQINVQEMFAGAMSFDGFHHLAKWEEYKDIFKIHMDQMRLGEMFYDSPGRFNSHIPRERLYVCIPEWYILLIFEKMGSDPNFVIYLTEPMSDERKRQLGLT